MSCAAAARSASTPFEHERTLLGPLTRSPVHDVVASCVCASALRRSGDHRRGTRSSGSGFADGQPAAFALVRPVRGRQDGRMALGRQTGSRPWMALDHPRAERARPSPQIRRDGHVRVLPPPRSRSSSDTSLDEPASRPSTSPCSISAKTTPSGRRRIGWREGRQAVSRLIVIEDADHLGPKRQPYLRRMMESGSGGSCFLFTARTPSRLIDAIQPRAACAHAARKPRADRGALEHACAQAGATDATVLEDVAHVVDGDSSRPLCHRTAGSARAAHRPQRTGALASGDKSSRCAWSSRKPSGATAHWRWEKQGARNTRVLYGAMGHLDRLMAAHHLEGDQVIEHVHQHLVEGRFHLPPDVLAELLDVVAKTDADLRRSSTARIHLEAMLHCFADVGRRAGLGA